MQPLKHIDDTRPMSEPSIDDDPEFMRVLAAAVQAVRLDTVPKVEIPIGHMPCCYYCGETAHEDVLFVEGTSTTGVICNNPRCWDQIG
jgi:hypothetical protein